MTINKDFKDLLHHLNVARARYLVVGAYAVIYYTEPRYTKDLDLWIEPTPLNAKKVYRALKNFGAPLQDVTERDLINPLMVYQIGIEPNRIDILMGIGKLGFAQAWKNRKLSHYGKEPISILGMDHLISAKREAGRTKDKLDLESLRTVRRQKVSGKRRPNKVKNLL